MFQSNTIIKSSVVFPEARIDHKRQSDIYDRADEHHVALLGDKAKCGGARYFTPLQFACICLYSDLLQFGIKGPLAAKIANRVRESAEEYPKAEQFALTVLMNTSISVLPVEAVELSTGQHQGIAIAFAIVIDLKNYAARVNKAIADAPRRVGDGDA